MNSGVRSPDRWEEPVTVDPAQIHTPAELAAALEELRRRRELSLAQVRDAADTLRRDAGWARPLPRSTVSDILNGKRMPSKDTLRTLLRICSVPAADLPHWLVAWERARTVDMARPPGWVRVREARPRLLGVHASIQVDPAATDLPVYVPRDLDADLHTKITTAADQGGFVLLIGRSSVGKSRALFEAVRAVLPEWWLLHPADLDELRTFTSTPIPRTVVWLDELQRYLDHPTGLRVGMLRRLIIAGVVVAATLWSDEYALRTAPRTPGQPERHAEDQQLLDLAQVIEVPDAFSLNERRRAETRAADRCIRIALDTPDAGFTQVLAAGPELVRRWECAPDRECYGRAVITAALDARRVGARAPVAREFLAAAAPGYLTPDQQAKAPADWLDRALAYATEPLRGAASTLTRVPAGMGQIAGYTVADYLHQHALRVRRTVQLPDIVWQALVEHHHPDDTGHLGDSAAQRGRTDFAVALYRQLTDAGDGFAACLAADLLVDQGRTDEAMVVLRPAAGHDRYAAERLADMLVQQGRLDELRERADHDWTGSAARRLIELLVEQGRADEAIELLRQRAEVGDGFAVVPLADLLIEQGRADEAMEVLRQRANASDHDNAQMLAVSRLDGLLLEHRRTDELRQRAEAGDSDAARLVAEVLVEQGHHDAAIDILRHVADGDKFAATQLAALLAEQGRIDELRQRATVGDVDADGRLVALLAEQGDHDELHERATAGSWSAAHRLIELLAERGRTDEAIDMLRQRADDDRYAADRLADLLVKRGRIDELRERASDDQYAADRLADLLAEHGRVDELSQRAADGDRSAHDQLVDLLAQQGRVEELRQRVADGDWSAGGRLVDLLAEQGRIDEIREETAAGTAGAVAALRRISGHPQGAGSGKDPAPPS